MEVKFIEGTNGFNWGKFAVLRFTGEEWAYISQLDKFPLLRARGWGPEHVWVLDLQTGEGFCVRHGGLAVADLEKHEVWVCPMFQPWLEWLYRQDIKDLSKLPGIVELIGESSLRGFRRSGCAFNQVLSHRTQKALSRYKLYHFHQLSGMTEETFDVLFDAQKTINKEVKRVMQENGFSFLATAKE